MAQAEEITMVEVDSAGVDSVEVVLVEEAVAGVVEEAVAVDSK